MLLVLLIIGLLTTQEASATRIWPLLSSSSSMEVAKPGCRDRCGNVTIPYPFGIGKPGCYFNEQFEVTCNNNLVLFGPYSDINEYDIIYVQHLSMDGSVMVVGTFCPNAYNKSTGKNRDGDDYGEGSSHGYFSISSKNKLVAIGCDIYAYVKDLDNGGEIVSGCASLCDKSNNSTNTSPSLMASRISSNHCTGSNGCCQTAISRWPRNFIASIQTMNTEKTLWASSNCSYFLVVENGISGFPQSPGKCQEDDCYEGGVAMDWVINGNVSCDKARKNPKYECGMNSRCVDATTSRGVGYRCICSPGYHGNPYLPHGCQDINECKNPNGTNCTNDTRCVNTPGGFHCDPVKHMPALQLSLGFAAAITLVMLVAVCLWLRKWLRKREEKKAKHKFFKRNGGLLLRQRISFNDGESSGNALLKLFLKEELERATDNFNESRILGKGGLGTVFKGMLSDGSIVAVKKSNAVDEDQIGQFVNEILILSQINHRHIVKVLGCCLETQVPLLVYEYISNGTLSSHIHANLNHCSDPTSVSTSDQLDVQTDDSHSRIILSWEHRLRIAVEIAGALSYMHSCASTPVLHRDIKSSNILLDDNFRAVVSDFGLSRLLSVDKTHLTTLVGGTFGYIDPEYFRTGQLTDKCDVYAFGVILAELLTSQRAVSSAKTELDPGLVMRFTSSLKQNCLFEIVDPEIVKEYEDEKVILDVAKLSKRCLHFNARKRPCMKEVAAALEQLRRMRQGQGGNISPISESSHGYSSDCTEEEEDNGQTSMSPK